MKKRIAIGVLTGALLWTAGLVSAEVKDFHGSGEYTMSKYETQTVAEERAVKEAERDALEQAGVYVESYTKTENMQVKKDTITVLTNGIMKITKRNITTDVTPAGDIRVKAEITATIDTDDINKNLKDTAAMEKLQEEYDELQERYQEQKDTLEKLKKDSSKNMPRWAKNKVEKEKNVREKDEEILNKYYWYWSAKNRDPQKTLEELNKLFEIDSSYPMLYADRAMVEEELGKYEEAIQDYTMAIALRKDSPELADRYLRERAEIYEKIGEDAKAIIDYSTYLERHPDEWTTYHSRGWAYYRLKQYNRAIADAEAGIDAFIKAKESDQWLNNRLHTELFLADLHVMKADSLQALERYQEAIEWYTKSIELAPKNPNYYFARGWTENAVKDYVSAITDYKMYLKYDPENKEERTEQAYCDISMAYYFLHQYETSIEYADKALALNPTSQDALDWKGLSELALGH